jgi:hypothetical protein
MFFATLSNIIGAIILISVVVPFFLIPVLFICWVYVFDDYDAYPSLIANNTSYFYFAVFYRSSARELKRLGKLMRNRRMNASLTDVQILF